MSIVAKRKASDPILQELKQIKATLSSLGRQPERIPLTLSERDIEEIGYKRLDPMVILIGRCYRFQCSICKHWFHDLAVMKFPRSRCKSCDKKQSKMGGKR